MLPWKHTPEKTHIHPTVFKSYVFKHYLWCNSNLQLFLNSNSILLFVLYRMWTIWNGSCCVFKKKCIPTKSFGIPSKFFLIENLTQDCWIRLSNASSLSIVLNVFAGTRLKNKRCSKFPSKISILRLWLVSRQMLSLILYKEVSHCF